MSKFSPFNYYIKVTKAYDEAGEWYVEGIASGTLEDRDDERMSVDVLKSFVEAIPLPLTNSHPRPGEVGSDMGEVIFADILNDENSSLYIKARLDKSNPLNEYLIKKIQEGKRFAFSIEGEMPIRQPVWSERLGKMISEFIRVIPTAISITSEPSYIPSFAEAVVKSYKDGIKELKKGSVTKESDEVEELKKQIKGYGEAENKEELKQQLIEKARDLKALDKLPEDWDVIKALTQKSKQIDNKLIVNKTNMPKKEETVETVETPVESETTETEKVESTEETTETPVEETTEVVDTTEVEKSVEEVETAVEKSLQEVDKVKKSAGEDDDMTGMVKAQCDLMKAHAAMVKNHAEMIKSHDALMKNHFEKLGALVNSASEKASADQVETEEGEPTGDADEKAAKSFKGIVEVLKSLAEEVEKSNGKIAELEKLPLAKKSLVRKSFDNGEIVEKPKSFVDVIKAGTQFN